RFFQGRMLERFGWIARNRKESPSELTGVGIERREKSANGIFGSADTNDNLTLRDARRHRDRVIVLWVCDSRLPKRLSGFGVESLKAGVDKWSDDLGLIDCNSAIYDSTTDFRAHCGLIDFRVPAPALLSRTGVDGKNNTPVRDAI